MVAFLTQDFLQYTAIALNTSVEFVESWQFTGGAGIVGQDRGTYTQLAYSERELSGSFSEALAPQEPVEVYAAG